MGQDAYTESYRKLYETLREHFSPQVSGRQLNQHYRATVARLASRMADVAARGGGDGVYTDEEREHLRYAAWWLGFGSPENTDSD